MFAFIAAALCVGLAALNIPFLDHPLNTIAFIFCLAMAGLNVGMGISSRN